jgi:hypothetical protein
VRAHFDAFVARHDPFVARDALPAGGAFIAFEPIIDDERRTNVIGLLTSMNMLIETRGGFNYTVPMQWAGCVTPGLGTPAPNIWSGRIRW